MANPRAPMVLHEQVLDGLAAAVPADDNESASFVKLRVLHLVLSQRGKALEVRQCCSTHAAAVPKCLSLPRLWSVCARRTWTPSPSRSWIGPL